MGWHVSRWRLLYESPGIRFTSLKMLQENVETPGSQVFDIEIDI